MPIISVRDNENNRWKRARERKKKDRKEQDTSLIFLNIYTTPQHALTQIILFLLKLLIKLTLKST